MEDSSEMLFKSVEDSDSDVESIFARDSDHEGSEPSRSQNYARETDESEESQSQNYSQDTQETKYEKFIKEKKYIVFESSLNQLLVRCQECGACIINKEESMKGAVITVTTECAEGCTFSWSSSPKIGVGKKVAFALNFLLTTIILTVGASFTSVKRVFDHLRIPFVSQQLYNQHCKKFIYPCVWFIWMKHQEALISSLHSLGSGIELAGDGRFDSPGFTAAICVYFVLCLTNKKVLAFSVVHKSQTGNKSSLMEPLGLTTCLHHLVSTGLWILRLATDRCSNIKALMEERFPMIDQEYDPWHWIKNVMKDLKKISKTKNGQPLAPWLKSINNMLWFSFSNCKKDPVRLQEMIMSIVGHTCNRHDFDKFTVFKKCLHGPLDKHSIPWLVPEEYPAQKLIETLKGKDGSRFLALEKMAHGMNTFLIESLNNKILVWAPKRLHYPPLSMLIRSALAALDFNENVHRGDATTRDGTPRYNIVTGRSGMQYSVKPIKNNNTHTTLDIIRALVLNCKDVNFVPDVEYPLPSYPKNTAKVEKPAKSEAVLKHKSRFKND